MFARVSPEYQVYHRKEVMKSSDDVSGSAHRILPLHLHLYFYLVFSRLCYSLSLSSLSLISFIFPFTSLLPLDLLPSVPPTVLDCTSVVPISPDSHFSQHLRHVHSQYYSEPGATQSFCRKCECSLLFHTLMIPSILLLHHSILPLNEGYRGVAPSHLGPYPAGSRA